ncbi:uncharacterized protein RCC_10352 [Ramularia collo-cygni]|uniref:Galactose oxidase n=1 Tax=Ramularia collo-cygni TaxID=112498 RepID=A0A2D3V2Y5_9PEZI|nr:uncharacterized protein RCC_10352 [Ramularia collo-cygni]CZT24627.1 uncharacterized protein RCC_10352 [Ramularia collo-cygni]
MRHPTQLGSLLALLFFLLSPGTASDPLPYNPTRILLAPNSTFAYFFEPSNTQGVLRVVDIQDAFATSTLSPTTLMGSLPFLNDNELVAYIPIVEPSGDITVVAGSCSAGPGETKLWRFQPDLGKGDGSGTWTSQQTLADGSEASGLPGMTFLGNAVGFAADVSGNAMDLDYYIFGGMCPFPNSTAETWVSAANYSNAMLSFSPSGNGYDIAAAANRAPPVAEAGFTMTGLTPTFSVRSNSGNQTQQQDFLLLGGHTQEAFLNMSQIALYSLPQESWTFLSVQQPSSTKTDLALAARQAATEIEPRSGHTAVLSEDGTQVVVFGGWVGDVSTPAMPQLAILHLGSEYGGDEAEAWSWTIPSQESTGLVAGEGIYGHGATLLPGGVMMVAGGYSIPASPSKRNVKRAASEKTYLFNATTGASIDTYNPPAYVAQFPSAKASSDGPLRKTSQQTGLGVGLGVGVVALLVLIFFYFWYARRLRRAREERERELVHSSDGSYAAHEEPFLSSGGIDGRGGDPWAMKDNPNNPDGMAQAGSTGLFVNALSPTRGLRKGLISKPYNYEQAPRYDENRANRGSGGIHPILERQDEDETSQDGHVFATPLPIQKIYQAERGYETSPERRQRELEAILSRNNPKNPFADPPPNPLGSHPVSPVSPIREDFFQRGTNTNRQGHSPTRRPLTAETEGSMNWTIVDGLAQPSENSGSTGRCSPTRTDDRTSSTLSDQSQRSVVSASSITRTMSTHTGKLLVAALAKDSAIGSFGEPSPREERGNAMSSSGRRSPFRLYNTARMPTYDVKGSMTNPAQSTDSFKTARSSFVHLQSEGEALLGGRPKDDPYHRALAAHQSTSGGGMSHLYNDDPSSTPTRRKQGWVGSLKRALTAMSTDRTFSFTAGSEVLTALADDSRTSSSSPTRPHHPTEDYGVAPRRTVSDGGALLKQKRGEKDWSEDNKTAYRRYRDDPDPGDWGEPSQSADFDGDNEWDVEGEGGKRDVQVMFTVPKARLRVVNADVERASLRSASDGAISRSESIQSLRAKRSRTEWDRVVPLPKTAEEHADDIFGTSGKKKAV